MNVASMHLEFKIGYDKIDSLNRKSYTPEEIDVFLNNAQNLILVSITKEGLESSTVLRNYTRNITENANITTFTNNASNKPNGFFVTLPTDCRLILAEEASISYTDCNGITQTKRTIVTPITHDRYNRAVMNPFTSPNDEEILQLPCNTPGLTDTVELITDGTYTLITYHVRYIREPQVIQFGTQYVSATVDQDCEFSTLQSHKEVVAIAVLLALNKLKDLESYKTQSEEVNNSH